MSRIVRISILFAMLLAVTAGAVFSQGAVGMLERKAWYVDEDKKTGQVLFWRIFLGDYNNVKLRRTFHGHGEIDVEAGMNFQLFSAGYIEGNGASARGRVSAHPMMRIRVGDEVTEIKIDNVDYIYDYGTKVAMKDGRKGDFFFYLHPEGTLMVPRRFQLTEFKLTKGTGEMSEIRDRMPIVAIAFSQDATRKAAQEPVTEEEE